MIEVRDRAGFRQVSFGIFESIHQLAMWYLDRHRAAELQVVGADIDAYKDKVANVADAGIFDEKLMRQCISDSIAAWGLTGRPELADFVR